MQHNQDYSINDHWRGVVGYVHLKSSFGYSIGHRPTEALIIFCLDSTCIYFNRSIHQEIDLKLNANGFDTKVKWEPSNLPNFNVLDLALFYYSPKKCLQFAMAKISTTNHGKCKVEFSKLLLHHTWMPFALQENLMKALLSQKVSTTSFCLIKNRTWWKITVALEEQWT